MLFSSQPFVFSSPPFVFLSPPFIRGSPPFEWAHDLHMRESCFHQPHCRLIILSMLINIDQPVTFWILASLSSEVRSYGFLQISTRSIIKFFSVLHLKDLRLSPTVFSLNNTCPNFLLEMTLSVDLTFLIPFLIPHFILRGLFFFCQHSPTFSYCLVLLIFALYSIPRYATFDFIGLGKHIWTLSIPSSCRVYSTFKAP